MTKNDMREVAEMKDYHIDYLYIDSPRSFGETMVYQIGTMQSRDEVVSDTHVHHRFFELTAILEGEGEVSANGQSVRVGRNEIFLSFPFETHRIVRTSSAALKYCYLAFDTVNESFQFSLDRIVGEFTRMEDRIIRDDTMLSALSQAVYEATGAEVFSAELSAALLTAIQIRIVRHYYPQKNDFRLPGKEEIFAYSVMNYINTHIYSMKSLRELSAAFGYEYSHISKLFSKTTSQSLGHYFHTQRMETARSLLGNGMSVGETAERLHYASIYSFSLAFKKQYGVSPSRYQDTCRTV